MPTTTRTGRAASASTGRFGRSTPAPSRTSRVQVPALRRRRQPEPTGLKKLTSAVQPLAGARKATPSSKKGKAGGLALAAAAAAGMAFKNRDRIPGMRQKENGTTASGANNSSPPVTPTM